MCLVALDVNGSLTETGHGGCLDCTRDSTPSMAALAAVNVNPTWSDVVAVSRVRPAECMCPHMTTSSDPSQLSSALEHRKRPLGQVFACLLLYCVDFSSACSLLDSGLLCFICPVPAYLQATCCTPHMSARAGGRGQAKTGKAVVVCVCRVGDYGQGPQTSTPATVMPTQIFTR